MSSALKHLEDMGYEVFDNFPLPLVKPLVNDPASTSSIAFSLDARTRGFDQEDVLKTAKELNATLLFITADENELIKRFTETRRRHPLSGDRPASSGIKQEQERVFELRKNADLVIDTTYLSVHDLRRALEGHFAIDRSDIMTVSLISFGFRHGLPREADLVMDVRFLKNPNWVPELKEKTGLDKPVGEYVEKDEGFEPFINKFKDIIEMLLPRYAQEGKSYLTIAIGCTGGHHRSVYTVETLKPWLENQGSHVHVLHRDIMR